MLPAITDIYPFSRRVISKVQAGSINPLLWGVSYMALPEVFTIVTNLSN